MTNNVFPRFALDSNNVAGLAWDAASIVTSALPDAAVGVPYSFQLEGSGVFSASGLPPGFSIGTGGLVSGTTAASGSYSVRVTVQLGASSVAVDLLLVVVAAAAPSGAGGWAVIIAKTRR